MSYFLDIFTQLEFHPKPNTTGLADTVTFVVEWLLASRLYSDALLAPGTDDGNRVLRVGFWVGMRSIRGLEVWSVAHTDMPPNLGSQCRQG